ncbi:protein embryonic flower 1 isoform X1 [Tanacetum coccineum]
MVIILIAAGVAQERALLHVLDVPEDRSDKPLTLELFDSSSSESSYTSFFGVSFALACWSCSLIIILNTSMFSLMKSGEGVFWANSAGLEGPSSQADWDTGLTDGVNVVANSRGPIGLSKWASIFVIVWFNSDPLEVAHFEAVAGLVMLLRHGTSVSGPDMSFDTSAFLEYVSGLGRASLTKVISYVSPSVIPKETIPINRHIQANFDSIFLGIIYAEKLEDQFLSVTQTLYSSAHRCELLIYLLSMDIDLNKEETTETSEFINFSIRSEYVAEMRKKDPKKCWPFGSLGDPDNFEGFASYQSTKSTVLSDLNNPADINGSDDTPEHTVTPNSTKVEISNGNEDQPEPTIDMSESLGANKITGKGINDGSLGLISSNVNNGQCQQKNSATEGAIVGNNVAVDNDASDVDLPRRKPKKFRLVSDILKDPASELRARCDTINPENVNSRFTAEIEDESDDNLTLERFFKKHQLKGVKVNDSTLNKKRKLINAEGPRVDKVKKSKHESKDSVENKLSVGPGIYSKKMIGIDGIDTQTMAKCMKNTQPPSSQEINKIAEVDNIEAKETENEDSEMAAVMLLARHFNEENPSASEQILRELKINTACACVKKKIRDHPTPFKTATKNPVLYAEKQNKFLEEKLEEIFCSVQMNDHLKDTTASGFKAQKKFCMKKAARRARVAQNRETLVCSVNRNPADFSIPKARNKFMRGG